MEYVNWIFRYLRGSARLVLAYEIGYSKSWYIVGYTYSDFVSDIDKRILVTGYTFTLNDNLVSWKSSLQDVMSLSTIEVEYIERTKAINEDLWLKRLVDRLEIYREIIRLMSDSQSAIYLTNSLVFHERTKCINLKFNFIRDVVSKGQVRLIKNKRQSSIYAYKDYHSLQV